MTTQTQNAEKTRLTLKGAATENARGAPGEDASEQEAYEQS